MRQNIFKNIIELFWAAHLLLGMELSLSMVCIPKETPLEKSLFFFKWLSIGASVLVRDGAGVHFPSQYWNPIQFGSCACCHSLCEFIQVLVLLCLKTLLSWCHSALLVLMILPLPFLHSSLGYEGRSLMKATIWLSVSKSLTLCILSSYTSQYQFPSTPRGSNSDAG